MVIVRTMLKLFLILCTGYGLNKAGIFDEYVNKKISSLIVNLTSPLLVIASVAGIETDSRSFVLKLIGAGILMYACFIIIGIIITRILPFPEKDRSVYQCMCVFANTSFMGYPVIQSILGTEAIFYTGMLHMAFSIYVYTYGVMCLTAGKDDHFTFNFKALLTPGFLLSILAVFIYLLNIPLPELITDTAETIGSVTSPLSMMMIGSSLAMYPLKDSLSDWHSYMFAAVRLLLIPAVTACVCRLIHLDAYYSAIAIIINGMPVASMTLMLATQYNANKEVVTRNIVVTTLLSVITIPLITALFAA